MGYFIVLVLLLILTSLGVAGFFMLRKPPNQANLQELSPKKKRQMANALTFRIALSIGLFLCVLVSWQMGWITPTGVPLRQN